MKKKVSVIIALIVMISAIGGILIYLYHEGQADRDFKEIQKEVQDDKFQKLLKLNKKNPDVIGWITVENTKIDYPVMKGDFYLYKNFDKEYSISGTPFVQDDWTQESKNSLIYGHNMWVEHTMFNSLHKYEKEKFWKKHKYGKFYVICESLSGEKYVECRNFTITHTIQTSIEDELWQDMGNETSNAELVDYLQWCRENHMYDTKIGSATDDGLVTLCTCSYHISGKREYGRILVVGAITQIAYK